MHEERTFWKGVASRGMLVPTPRNIVNVKTVFARTKTDITRVQRCSLALLDLYTALYSLKL